MLGFCTVPVSVYLVKLITVCPGKTNEMLNVWKHLQENAWRLSGSIAKPFNHRYPNFTWLTCKWLVRPTESLIACLLSSLKSLTFCQLIFYGVTPFTLLDFHSIHPSPEKCWHCNDPTFQQVLYNACLPTTEGRNKPLTFLNAASWNPETLSILWLAPPGAPCKCCERFSNILTCRPKESIQYGRF